MGDSEYNEVGIDEIASTIAVEPAKEEEPPNILTTKDLARIQIWDRNCNISLWNRDTTMISLNKLLTYFFRHIREFIDRNYIPIIPHSIGRKRKHIAVEPDDDSKSESDEEIPNLTISSHRATTHVYTRKKNIKVRAVKKKKVTPTSGVVIKKKIPSRMIRKTAAAPAFGVTTNAAIRRVVVEELNFRKENTTTASTSPTNPIILKLEGGD